MQLDICIMVILQVFKLLLHYLFILFENDQIIEFKILNLSLIHK